MVRIVLDQLRRHRTEECGRVESGYNASKLGELSGEEHGLSEQQMVQSKNKADGLEMVRR
jgi:hypothetical protein